MDRIAYVHSLKELPLAIDKQAAVTRDNVSLLVDGVLFLRVHDPVRASYGVDNALYAVAQLAQTTMRSELGKIRFGAAGGRGRLGQGFGGAASGPRRPALLLRSHHLSPNPRPVPPAATAWTRRSRSARR